VSLALRLVALVFPVLLGALAGRVGLYAKPLAAVGHLNRYALTFGFPALVFCGLLDARFQMPDSVAFWVAVPLSLVASLALGRALVAALVPADGGRRRRATGAMALTSAFGNIAYLGLPFVSKVLGDEATGVASLAVAIHVALAMLVGPALLLRWGSDASGERPDYGSLARQPLLWAPVVGLAARSLPEPMQELALEVAKPVGASAAPVALFLLGLYVQQNLRVLRRVDVSAAVVVGCKLLLLPTVTFGVVLALSTWGGLGALEARVLFLLAAMPAAITTFAIAERYDVAAQEVSQAIVLSTLVAALTLPLCVAAVNLLPSP
jgi:predicted permease